MPTYTTSLFIFRRDLRLEDNTALLECLQKSKSVIPIFIFDPRQIKNNPYRSNFSVQFMLESLEELDDFLKNRSSQLNYFQGKAEEVVRKVLMDHSIDAVFINKDYTPFSVKRDLAIKEICESLKKDFKEFDDALLNAPGSVIKQDGGIYTVFSPYHRKAREQIVVKPKTNNYQRFMSERIKGSITSIPKDILNQCNSSSVIKGGRSQALQILRNLGRFRNYDDKRDFPAMDRTTHLSAHNKFGTVSIREVYHAIRDQLGLKHTLISELYWRGFFTQIAYYFPSVFGESFYKKYDQITWSRSEKNLKAWCEGRTGVPIVDAGMRELNNTGFMHNRVRMITASFLVKDLHIDWRKGERYFAQQLIDYDPSVNNGNWQWAASTGCDKQPYFRIFNPWLQQEKYDADCQYIKKWIPELRKVDAKKIHRFDHNSSNQPSGYPPPIVNHTEESQRAKEMFKAVSLN